MDDTRPSERRTDRQETQRAGWGKKKKKVRRFQSNEPTSQTDWRMDGKQTASEKRWWRGRRRRWREEMSDACCFSQTSRQLILPQKTLHRKSERNYKRCKSVSPQSFKDFHLNQILLFFSTWRKLYNLWSEGLRSLWRDPHVSSS